MSSAFLFIRLTNVFGAPAGTRLFCERWRYNSKQYTGSWDFPGGAVVGTSAPSAGECRFHPWSGNWDGTCLTAKEQKQIHERLEKMVHNKKNLKKKFPVLKGLLTGARQTRYISTQYIRRKMRGWRKQQACLMEGCRRGREDPADP